MKHRIGIAVVLAAAALALVSLAALAGHIAGPVPVADIGKRIPHKPFVHQATIVTVGDPADWTWLAGTAEQTARWNPCTPITWSYPAGASPMVRRITDHSFMLLARYTGYAFQRVDRGAAITITTHPDGDPFLANAIGATYVYADTGADGAQWLTSVQIGVLDRVARMKKGYTNTLLHELGHAVGLGHAEDYREVMAATSGALKYGAGDRAGLASVRPSVCEPVVAARGTVHRLHWRVR